MSENTSSAAADTGARSNRKPDYKIGDVSVWIEPRRDDPTKKVASIAVGDQKDGRKYYKTGTAVNKVELSAKEIAHLFIGDDLPIEFNGPSGPYNATIARKEIVTKPWKNNPDKVDRFVNFGIAIHLEKDEVKNGQKTGEKDHWGYKVDKISFPRFIKHGDQTLELSAANIFKLLNKERVEVNGVEVKIDRIEKQGTYEKAKLATSTATPAEVVNEAETVPVASAGVAV